MTVAQRAFMNENNLCSSLRWRQNRVNEHIGGVQCCFLDKENLNCTPPCNSKEDCWKWIESVKLHPWQRENQHSPAASDDTYLTSHSGVWESIRANSLCGRLLQDNILEMWKLNSSRTFACHFTSFRIKSCWDDGNVFYWLKLSDIFLGLLSIFTLLICAWKSTLTYIYEHKQLKNCNRYASTFQSKQTSQFQKLSIIF